jgi:hypothetical protein
MVQLEAAEVSRHSPGIVLIRFRPNVGVEAHHVPDIVKSVGAASNGNLHGNLVDATHLMFMSSEARQAFGAQSPDSLSGTAIVVTSALQRTMGNLYLSVARPQNPTRIFSSEPDAVAWLRQRNEERLKQGSSTLSPGSD